MTEPELTQTCKLTLVWPVTTVKENEKQQRIQGILWEQRDRRVVQVSKMATLFPVETDEWTILLPNVFWMAFP